MYGTPFDKELSVLERRLANVTALTTQIRTLEKQRNLRDAEARSFLLAEAAEKLALQARVLPAYLGNPQAFSILEQRLAPVWDISIGFTKEGWFLLKIPALLPKKSSGSAEFIRSMLYPGMKRFFHGRQPVRYKDSVLVFRHVYNRKRPQRQYRDHDNIELNMVADIIALYLLPDDAPLRCAHYYCSAHGDTDYTEVYVVPKGDFIHWLELYGKAGSISGSVSGVPP